MTSKNLRLEHIRAAVQDIAEASDELFDLVSDARRRGCSWDSIASALQVRYTNGSRGALGDLLPGGRSSTSVRTFYHERIERRNS